ncbi:hypothetical protein D3C72_1660400 [compost metagenome]
MEGNVFIWIGILYNLRYRSKDLLFLSFPYFYQNIAASVKIFCQNHCWYYFATKRLTMEIFNDSDGDNLKVFIQDTEVVYPKLFCRTFGHKGIIDTFVFSQIHFNMRIIFRSQ